MKPLAPNTLIQHRYLVVQLIGKGGMGDVYLAVDQRLGSAVALKRMLFTDEEALLNSFQREAKTLARLRHPALTKVSDHFQEGDNQYLVMEHISGDDLSKRLKANGRPFPLSWVLYWADQLLDALQYLHSHEPPIIHRDIKPQNLKLTAENQIILLDFGLAKDSLGETRLGTSGDLVAYTPNYASMEQIRGTGTTARSDIYSLSATMYQLLSNTVPTDALSRADSVLNNQPDPITPLNQLNEEVPPSISDIVLKGMNLSSEQRFANAKEMQLVLREAYNQIQQGTAAQTVAFNTNESSAPILQADIKTDQFSVPDGSTPVGEETEVMPIGENTEVMPIGATDENVVAETETPVDFNATVPFGSPFSEDSTVAEIGEEGDAMQTAVISDSFASEAAVLPIDEGFSNAEKTELMQVAFDSSSVGETNEVFPQPDSAPIVEQSEFYSADATAENVFEGNSGDQSYGPEMTTPMVNFGNEIAELPANETSNFDSPGQESFEATPESNDKAARATAGGGSSKALLIVAVLAILGLLGIGAVGAGVYVFMPELLGFSSSTSTPTPEPTATPTTEPTVEPVLTPTVEITDGSNSNVDAPNNNIGGNNENTNVTIIDNPPTKLPTGQPISQPSPRPTSPPTSQPTVQPTPQPTRQPTVQPTRLPTVQPTRQPTVPPLKPPPTRAATVRPTVNPTIIN